jgi:formamidopyrimidine-DNA glycosylase
MTEVRPPGTRELDQAVSLAPAINPHNDAFPWPYLGARLHAVSEPLRALLLDQAFMTGLNGPEVDAILWTSGLRHDRRSDSLSPGEVRRLYRAVREPAEPPAKGRAGSAEVDIDLTDGAVGADGANEADAGDATLVAGAPCRRCRTTLVGEVLPGGDRTSYCPKCQS